MYLSFRGFVRSVSDMQKGLILILGTFKQTGRHLKLFSCLTVSPLILCEGIFDSRTGPELARFHDSSEYGATRLNGKNPRNLVQRNNAHDHGKLRAPPPNATFK